MEEHPPAIAFREVSFAYPCGEGELPVLDGVSLSVPAGEWVTVIGPSGCGKTTLLRIGAGLLAPDRGEVLFRGQARGAGTETAYMPQSDTLLPWRDALRNALLPVEVMGGDRQSARAETLALFAEFGLAGFERSYPHELSGGMRQRLALLRTLLAHREILLLDEPFGALDALTRAALQEWLAEVWRVHCKTVLFVTHDVREAALLSDEIYVLSPRPARIVAAHCPAAPRPRDRTDPRVAEAEAELLRSLRLHG